MFGRLCSSSGIDCAATERALTADAHLHEFVQDELSLQQQLYQSQHPNDECVGINFLVVPPLTSDSFAERVLRIAVPHRSHSRLVGRPAATKSRRPSS